MVLSNNGRNSVGGASPMQQLRHDSDSHVREDFAGCMKQLESKFGLFIKYPLYQIEIYKYKCENY